MAMNPVTLMRHALTARALAPQRAAVEVAVSSTPQPTDRSSLQQAAGNLRNVKKLIHFIVVSSLTPQQAAGNALAVAFLVGQNDRGLELEQ
jgi:hypothetical protein